VRRSRGVARGYGGAGEIVLVDAHGLTSDNPRRFDYRNRRRPLYPLEDLADFGDNLT
jgi:hypothetical protein